jgi:hypothetical protein
VDRIAAFGPRIDGDIGITGHLMKIPAGEEDDTFGCLPVQSPPKIKDWVALVERGQCSFLQKVKTMQDSGAIAVIVGDKRYNGWVTMYAPGKLYSLYERSKLLIICNKQVILLMYIFQVYL